MSAVPQQDDEIWVEFDALRHSIKSNTVDRLKQMITGIAEECGTMLSKSGKKQDLIDRITRELDTIRYSGQIEQWKRARAVLHRVRVSGQYTSSAPTRTFAANPEFAHSNVHGSSYVPPRPAMPTQHSSTSVPSSSLPRYDMYAPPRRAAPTPTASTTPRPNIPIRFKASPFFKVDQVVSNVVECPESAGSMDRRTQALQFSLTQEQASKLRDGSKYQLRLYCTTSTFYTTAQNAFRTNSQPCPIEFPATCEVRVNNLVLQANLKGIKKKPGTAPPADLSKIARLDAGVSNRIDMVYVNGQANSGPKKFYLVVYLVEFSSVEQLVDRLKKGKFRTLDEVKTQMVAKAGGDDDDDIVAGKQKMSLKCPLSYTRIKEPCRSEKCVHPQCFDAFSWYSVMEQTTTWLCPVCEKALNPEELIIDGYFRSILDQTPESVEEVEVEPDGEWHTEESRYGSKTWMDSHRRGVPVKAEAVEQMPSGAQGAQPSLLSAISSSAQQSASLRKLEDVVVLDSDSEYEDETRVKRELSPSIPIPRPLNTVRNGTSSSLGSSEAAVSAVIDLTLDSDDEARPPPPVHATKRKISDVTHNAETMHKKSRATDPTLTQNTRKELLNSYTGYANGPSAPVPSSYAPPLRRQTSSSSQRSLRSPSAGTGSYYPQQSPSASAPVPRFDPYYSSGSPPGVYNYNLNGTAPPHADRQGQSAPAYHAYSSPRATNGNRQPWS